MDLFLQNMMELKNEVDLDKGQQKITRSYKK